MLNVRLAQYQTEMLLYLPIEMLVEMYYGNIFDTQIFDSPILIHHLSDKYMIYDVVTFQQFLVAYDSRYNTPRSTNIDVATIAFIGGDINKVLNISNYRDIIRGVLMTGKPDKVKEILRMINIMLSVDPYEVVGCSDLYNPGITNYCSLAPLCNSSYSIAIFNGAIDVDSTDYDNIVYHAFLSNNHIIMVKYLPYTNIIIPWPDTNYIQRLRLTYDDQHIRTQMLEVFNEYVWYSKMIFVDQLRDQIAIVHRRCLEAINI